MHRLVIPALSVVSFGIGGTLGTFYERYSFLLSYLHLFPWSVTLKLTQTKVHEYQRLKFCKYLVEMIQ